MYSEKTTAAEIVKGLNLTNYEIIVTGATSGIGIETARALASVGASVTITARDLEKGKEIIEDIKKKTKNDKIQLEELRLDSLKSVRAFVGRFLAKKKPLNILINNAGIMGCPKSYTEDGFEIQMATNYLGHFELTRGLIPALQEGFKTSGRFSRVINISSLLHAMSDINYDDINFKKREYDSFISYGQSKTAQILFSVALTEKYKDKGIVSNSVMPGVIATNLSRHMDEQEMKKRGMIDEKGNLLIKLLTVEQGAATQVWASIAKDLEGRGGLYLEKCSIGKAGLTSQEVLTNSYGVTSFAIDKKNAEKLWKVTENMLNISQKDKKTSICLLL